MNRLQNMYILLIYINLAQFLYLLISTYFIIDMKYSQTPFKLKREEFTSQIKKQIVWTKKQQIRKALIQTEKKNQISSCFTQISDKLFMNSLNHKALDDLEQLFFNEGFYFTKDTCQVLRPALEDLFQISQSSPLDPNDQELQQLCRTRKQKANKSLYKLLYLLCMNANKYPNHGIPIGKEFVAITMDILQKSTDQNVRRMALKFLHQLSLAPEYKSFIISRDIFITLKEPTFKEMINIIEIFLYNLFNSKALALQEKYVKQLSDLFEERRELFQTESSLERLYYFVKDFVGVVKDGAVNSQILFPFIFHLLQVMEKIQVENYKFYVCYGQILKHLFEKLYIMHSFERNEIELIIKTFLKIENMMLVLKSQCDKDLQTQLNDENMGEITSRNIKLNKLCLLFCEIFTLLIQSNRTFFSPQIYHIRHRFQTYYLKYGSWPNRRQFVMAYLRLRQLSQNEVKYYEIERFADFCSQFIEDYQIRVVCLKMLVKAFNTNKKIADEDIMFQLKNHYQSIQQEFKDDFSTFLLRKMPNEDEIAQYEENARIKREQAEKREQQREEQEEKEYIKKKSEAKKKGYSNAKLLKKLQRESITLQAQQSQNGLSQDEKDEKYRN